MALQRKKKINVEVGLTIQEMREEAGYTQEKLSELIEITPNHLSAIERGASGVSLETLRKICRILGVSADDILFGKREESRRSEFLARQISEVPEECKPQVDKVISGILEMAELMRR